MSGTAKGWGRVLLTRLCRIYTVKTMRQLQPLLLIANSGAAMKTAYLLVVASMKLAKSCFILA